MKRLAIIAALLAGAPAVAAPIAITNAVAHTARGETVIQGATIIIDGGRITAIGALDEAPLALAGPPVLLLRLLARLPRAATVDLVLVGVCACAKVPTIEIPRGLVGDGPVR